MEIPCPRPIVHLHYLEHFGASAYNKFLILPAGLLLQASKANASGGPMNDEGMGVIPAQTQLSTSLSLNLGMAGKTVSIYNN